MKILFLTPSITDTCSFYRSGGIAPDLSRKLNCQIDVMQWDKIVLHWQIIIDYDLIMMQRPFTREAVNLADYVKNIKIPLWIDYDDNLFVVPPENPQYKLYGAESRENIKKLLEYADVVSVTSEVLKISLSEHNKNIEVIPNAFNDFLFKNTTITAQRSKLVMWRGGPSHIFDIMCWSDSINKAVKEFTDWQFLFLGFNPWFLAESNNLFTLDAMDVMVYFRQVKRMTPAMLHVPLNKNLFNECKSNIAWIEATYFGAITLAPDWDIWHVPGIINYHDIDSYYNGIKAVLKNEVNAEAYIRMAWQYITDELMLSKINVKRIELINRLI